MTRRKAAGTMLLQSLFCASVVGIQFWIYGWSMIMSRSNSVIIGNLDLAFLRNTLGYGSQSNVAIPDILLAAFHFTFVTATAMILAGAMLERGRLFPTMLFLLCWVTFVYCFLAYVKSPQGILVLTDSGNGTPMAGYTPSESTICISLPP
jgi:ammonium transporter, Amt family